MSLAAFIIPFCPYAAIVCSFVTWFLYRHALDRMEERGITREEIAEGLESPETTYTSEDDDSRLVILGKTASGRPLMIVVEKANHEAIVTVAERE